MSDDSLQIFAEEAEDLLSLAEQALLNLDDLSDEGETLDGINDLFRTFHTIKGAAGLFGLDAIVDFTHVVESVLGKIREGLLKVDEPMVSLFLLSRDHLDNLVNHVFSGATELSAELKQTDETLLKSLNCYLQSAPITGEAETESEAAPDHTSSAGTITERDTPSVVSANWHISLRFGPNVFRNGMDPASFITYLHNIGDLLSVTLIDDAIPTWSEFDPESCYLGFEIVLIAPNADKETLEDVFEFVQDDCKISILPPNSRVDSYVRMIEELPEEDLRIGEILVACGALTEREKDDILNAQDKMKDDLTADGEAPKIEPLGQMAIDQQMVKPLVVDAAIERQNVVKVQRDASQQTIRVNALKLENLVNLVGELVIGSANSELNSRRLGDAELNVAMENLLRLVEEVRDTALGLRMVQIGETFNRYKRVVREASRDTGKDIELLISGAETELDKTLIEKIADPLMHLVRNAIDHGIESPAIRAERGKPVKGQVKLEAFHDSGSIIIQIVDDGGGLSKENILNKALEKGLIQEGQLLSDKEVYRLIFEAGFSTATSISNLSGRGVGMDVVRKNIESLRGQVELESVEGKGTTISIRLPLTLAIIDGFQVRVGESQYIVPLEMVEECLELNDSHQGSNTAGNYINLRGEILPFVHMREVFNAAERTMAEQEAKHRDNIVVVKFAGKKAGFVVDELLGEHQAVIKPLGKVFQNLKGISGTTILGSGEVALIIDAPEMLQRIETSSTQGKNSARVMH